MLIVGVDEGAADRGQCVAAVVRGRTSRVESGFCFKHMILINYVLASHLQIPIQRRLPDA